MAKYIGLSCYAIQSPNFPVAKWLKITARITKANPACAVLWGSFGDNNDGIRIFMSEYAGHDKMLEIHMANGAGRRKDNSGVGHFLPGIRAAEYSKLLKKKDAGLFAKIDIRIITITDFCHNIDDTRTRFVLSPELEDDLDDDAFQILVQRIKDVWDWEIVRSPDGHNPNRAGADFSEKHGSAAKGDGKTICNQDGDESFTVAEGKKFLDSNKKALAAILWSRKHQGEGLPRRKRKFQIPPKDVTDIGGLLAKY